MQRLAALCALACSCSAIRLTGEQPAYAPLQCQRGDRAGNEIGAKMERIYWHSGKFDDVIERLLTPSGDDNATFPWRGKEFPLSRDSIQQASAPYGHTGAPLRLRKAMSKLIQSPSQTLTIATLGGSMTHGQEANIAWPERLELLSRDLKYPVKVINLSVRGTTSKWAIAHMSTLSKQLERADIVLVDYAINDVPGGWMGTYAYRGGQGEATANFRVDGITHRSSQ